MTPTHRIGYGYDVHRIIENRPLILGGVDVPSSFGLDGHSDADVLAHAVADAVLGAAGLPDIGHYFPPDDVRWQNMDSMNILEKARDEIAEAGYTIANIDATVVAEAPKLASHIFGMKTRLAETLGIHPSQVGVKATTNEGLGSIGRGEGIAAHAACLVHAS